jgi:pyruvate-formate lyase
MILNHIAVFVDKLLSGGSFSYSASWVVRVAGYSDYFCDIGRELQDEIISRTTQEAL